MYFQAKRPEDIVNHCLSAREYRVGVDMVSRSDDHGDVGDDGDDADDPEVHVDDDDDGGL